MWMQLRPLDFHLRVLQLSVASVLIVFPPMSIRVMWIRCLGRSLLFVLSTLEHCPYYQSSDYEDANSCANANPCRCTGTQRTRVVRCGACSFWILVTLLCLSLDRRSWRRRSGRCGRQRFRGCGRTIQYRQVARLPCNGYRLDLDLRD